MLLEQIFPTLAPPVNVIRNFFTGNGTSREVSYCSLTRVAFGRGRSFGGPLFCCFFLFISLLPGGLALRLLIFENQVFRGDLTLPIFLEHICDKPLGISINKRKREYFMRSTNFVSIRSVISWGDGQGIRYRLNWVFEVKNKDILLGTKKHSHLLQKFQH